MGPSKSSAAAIGLLVMAALVAGCSSGGGNSATDQGVAGGRASDAGLSFAIPAGWHRIPLRGLPRARVPVEVGSFEPSGAVRTICDPRRIVGQIPTRGALVQLLEDHGAGAVGAGRVEEYPPLRKPFDLGSPRGQECGESYETTSFRHGGRVFGLRIWTAPTGADARVRADIERWWTASAPIPAAGTAAVPRTQRLAVDYGPYLGVRCAQANSIHCDRIGIDIVLNRKARGVSATLAGRTVVLRTPGLHNGVRGKDWVGSLPGAGMTRKGSGFFIPAAGRGEGIWVGDPPVRMPVEITAIYADGYRHSRVFDDVRLNPGWG